MPTVSPEVPDPAQQPLRIAAAGPARRSWLRQRPATRLLTEADVPARPLSDRLRLLSFNIQSGIRTERYREYVTRGWRQFVHDVDRPDNLDRIGAMLADFDLIALQEVDAGSYRSGFTNQVAWLAARAQLPFWYAQRNRRLGRFAQHGNGLLARTEPTELLDHPLPSTIPGRGAIIATFPCADGISLLVVTAHLSLGQRARTLQLEWISEQIGDHPRVVVMGDLNSSSAALLERSPLSRTRLVAAPSQRLATYPSWQPRLDLDHILLSPGLQVENARLLPCRYSDHLPLAVDILLPNAARN